MDVPSPCFISHAYSDRRVEEAAAALPAGTSAIIFPPIRVSPTEFVSSPLIDALKQARSLLIVEGDYESRSPWVAFEADFAAQNDIPIFRFTRDGRIVRDLAIRPRAAVFASYTMGDKDVVHWLCDWLRRERGFHVRDETQWRNTAPNHGIQREMDDILERGGYLVAFLSSKAMQSEWVKAEIHTAISAKPGQVFIAFLDSAQSAQDSNLQFQLTRLQREGLTIDLASGAAGGNGIDLNRLDDLMVRLIHLVHKQNSN